MARNEALRVLDHVWESFWHVGEVPGPSERRSMGSLLGWNSADFWRKDQLKPVMSALVTSDGGVGVARNQRWLIISGCGWDLVDVSNVQHLRLEQIEGSRCPKLWTANGMLSATQRAVLTIEPLGEVCYPLVLNSTPDVLSLGRRCVEMGYEFHWKRGSMSPHFVLPDDSVIHLQVDGFIPYLPVDAIPMTTGRRKGRVAAAETFRFTSDELG
jgi:hypothetical protein